MADYYSIITARGAELEAAAIASGGVVNLAQFAIGDGNGLAVTPDPTLTTLVHEVYRGYIAGKSVSKEQPSQVTIQLVLPANVGGFTVREIGILTDAGELYAVGNCAAIEKPADGVNVTMNFRLAISPTEEIVLVVSTGDGLFLRQDANLADVLDKEQGRNNLGLKSAAEVDAQKSIGDAEPGRALISGLATAANVDAVPASGGDVGFLENAEYYGIKPYNWPGSGGYQNQITDPRALLFLAEYIAPGNIFLPIIKAIIQTQSLGYQASVSYGALTSGNQEYPSACIHILKNIGAGVFRDSTWIFDPNDDSFTSGGPIRTDGEITSGADIIAKKGLYEDGGAVRAYSKNNPPPAIDLSWLASIDWVNQLINQVQNWAQTSFVSRTRYGTSAYYAAPGNVVFWDYQAPTGCVLSGVNIQDTGSNSADNVAGVYYKPQQDAINGIWVTVQG
ncbi:phage tail protein [Cedecea davisae]|uniref:phage tail protein n=1 Tax=Cedecea davisae TaxID=158484 RepID=UPI001D0B166E|nr:phage tail protein [Cedecea davisae]